MAFKLKIRNLVTQLHIAAKTLTTSQIAGNYKSAYKGSGLEFDGFRKYSSEDDSVLIDWKASVRSGDLLIKEFVEERNLNIYFLLDVSNTMLFGSTAKMKNQYAAELIASIAYTSVLNDDCVGFGLFNDKVIKGLKPESGDQQYYMMLKALTDNKSYGGKYDLANALEFALTFLEESSVLFIVSDFIGLKKGWEETMKKAANKFDVIAIMVRDPRDRDLPIIKEDVVIGSPYNGEKLIVKPDKIRKEYSSYVKKQEYELGDFLKRLGVEFLSLTTDKDFVNPLIKMFRGREEIYH